MIDSLVVRPRVDSPQIEAKDEFSRQVVLLLRALNKVLKLKGKRRPNRHKRKRIKLEKQRAKQRRALRDRAREGLVLVIRKARTKPCTDCGLFYGTQHMEFDHLDSSQKRFCIGDGKHKSMGQLLAEIAKTQVVCCSCHEKREIARGRTHGDGPRPCPNVAVRGILKPVPVVA